MRLIFFCVLMSGFCVNGQTVDSLRLAKLPPPRLDAVPADFATRNFGFFCRQELKLDKVTPIPVRFRLGSQADCDRLEGKSGYR